ncbi:MAG: EscU/YscU/HrcU family type III secretion system export apparatus switch protein [Thermoleophilaceae bacterium]
MPERRRRATALHYEEGGGAPKVVASGQGLIADRIIEIAKEAGVPIRSNAALTEALSALDIGSEVPEEMWQAVAETLAWAYRLDLRASGQ